MEQGQIQPARTVAYRALCLGALLQRSEYEATLHDMGRVLPFERVRDHLHDSQQQQINRLQTWLNNEGITDYLSGAEQHLLQKAPGRWTERTLTSVGWRIESAGVMLWALNRLDDLPPCDTRFELDEVLEPLDIFNSTIDFIWCATLRPEADLFALRDRAELWNWRSRATELARMGVRPPEGVTFREIIRFTAERACNNGQLPYLIDGDFPAFGKPYADLNDDEYALISALAYERYSAFNWLCELSSEWETIPIDR
jgi:hypothetical protein